jgi:hypothetical protein
MNSIYNILDGINSITWLLIAIAILVLSIAHLLIEGLKIECQPFDEIDEELYKIDTFYIFRDHYGYVIKDDNCMAKRFDENEANLFAKQNPSYEIKLITPAHRCGVEDWQVAENYF